MMENNTREAVAVAVDDRSLTALLLIDLPLVSIKLFGMLIVYILVMSLSWLNYWGLRLRGRKIRMNLD